MSGVPTVELEDLELPPGGIVGPAYATAVEALAIGLSRHGAVVLRLPELTNGRTLQAGLTALLAGNTRSLPGCKLREWRVGGPPDVGAIEEVGAGRELAQWGAHIGRALCSVQTAHLPRHGATKCCFLPAEFRDQLCHVPKCCLLPS